MTNTQRREVSGVLLLSAMTLTRHTHTHTQLQLLIDLFQIIILTRTAADEKTAYSMYTYTYWVSVLACIHKHIIFSAAS